MKRPIGLHSIFLTVLSTVLAGSLFAFTTNQSASVVIGQSAFNTAVAGASVSQMTNPYDVWPAGSGLFISEDGNHRYLFFNGIPASNGAAANLVIGQPDFTTTSANTGGLSAKSADFPRGSIAFGSRLFAADIGNNRVLIFNHFPVTNFAPADVVVGQPDFASGAANQGLAAPTSQTLSAPHLLFTNGTKFFIADVSNNRVLIYKSIPVTNNAPADLVIGQPDFNSAAPNNDTGGISARTLNGPRGICLVGSKLVVAERDNNRVLIFNNVPVTNYAAANVVVGQPNFASNAPNQGLAAPTSQTLNNAYGVASDGVSLFIADIGNNRVLIYNSLPVTNNAPADEVLGQPDMVSNSPNQGGAPAANTFNQPAGLAVSGSNLFVADVFNNRVLVFGPTATNTPTPTPTSTPTNTPTPTATLGALPSSGTVFVYPSPATGLTVHVAYNMAGSGQVQIQVWNANAELAATVEDPKGAGVQTSTVDIHAFATGVYFYRLKLTYDSGGMETLKTGKFFVQH